MADSKTQSGRDAAHRTANGIFAAWEKRTALVKQEMQAENAASDAKTARLKALRLAKEQEDAETAAAAPAKPVPAAPRKRAAARRIVT